MPVPPVPLLSVVFKPGAAVEGTLKVDILPLEGRKARIGLARTAWMMLGSVGLIGGSLLAATVPASAGSSGGYSLYQCANGGKGTLASCSGTNYIHGDLNPNDSHWAEGDFVPFQLRLTGLSAGSYTVAVKYKTVDKGLHAYDYLGSFDATETTSPTATARDANANNPCSAVIPSCDPTHPTDTANIPAANLSQVNSICHATLNSFQPTSPTGKFSLWGPSGSSLGAVAYESPLNQPTQTGGSVSACYTIVDVPVTVGAGGGSLVLAWSGHVAAAADWGPNTGAGGISGDPYHMFVDHVTGLSSTGNQDRAMTVGATAPTLSTIIVDAANTPVTTVPMGTSVHDTALLTGTTSTAGGTVTYKLFHSPDCTGTATSTDTVTVTNGVVPDSPSSTPGVGTWSYLVSYSGDPKNATATAACEGPLTVNEVLASLVNVAKSEPTPGDGQTVTAGQSAAITYELAVTNAGSADASNIVVTDVIPTGSTYVAGSAGPAADAPVYDSTTNTIKWTVPSVPAGTVSSPIDLTFRATVDAADLNGSTISNVASYDCTPQQQLETSIRRAAVQMCSTNEVSNPVIVKQTGGNPQVTTTTTTVKPTTTTTKPALAFTGSGSGLLGALGAGLVGSGGLVLLLNRRRGLSGKHFAQK